MIISDSFQALSVFTFFLGLLFENFISSYGHLLRLKPSETDTVAINDYKKEDINVKTKGIYTSILSGSFSYLLLPNSIKIITTNKCDFWNFDLLLTMFIFVNLLMIGITVFSIIYVIKAHKYSRKNWPTFYI